jgi:uncharacterized protein
MKLSRAERLILSNQYRILQALYPKEKESLAAARAAVERGYEAHYDSVAGHVCDDKDALGEEQCREVVDILEMFDSLKRSYAQLADRSRIEERRTKFRGFDGSDQLEAACAAYARFYCGLDGGRYQDLDRGDDFHSPMPLLGTYRKMLGAWRASKDQSNLTREDIVRMTTF